MAKKMLIDATHAEETRVVVVNGNVLENFDIEIAARKQLKGNVYLAKVTRVEPSLQAAFVEYGGNRHGFLSFNEIHPDYYQIPIADRKKLVAEETAAEDKEGGEDSDSVEDVGGDEIEEEVERRRRPSYRGYKIQEVIKRRQILLVQVVKEERGNKGAALTTYLSLAGRYCVLMPNTNRGGGISRKIDNPGDRKRLKAVLDYLDIPEGIGVIVRTAGAERSKAEIKRDYDYLMKQWIAIRELTLASSAPTLIYEEASLIKRSIRDLYSNQIDEILVSGDESYRLAKDFMKTMIPSHAVRVKQYKDGDIPILHRYKVESQIDAIHHPIVQLQSGGYIVLNSTEALVAIDVNSGRATRGRNIEETAYKTNLEASEEIARQLRLRDLAGLVVIDYIDMEVSRNIHAVERKLKEALRTDRARIQVGRISHFGLLEMSRQRLRPSVMESAGMVCPTCAGTGHVRSTEATALLVLRALEEEGINKPSALVTLYVPAAVALYILNPKRAALAEIEARYQFAVTVNIDESLHSPDFRLERKPVTAEGETPSAVAEAVPEAANATQSEPRKRRPRRQRSSRREETDTEAAAASAEEIQPAGAETAEETTAAGESEGKPKRRRRGRRGGRRRSQKSAETTAAAESAEAESRENMAEEPAGAEPVAAMTPVDAAAESPDTADTAETPAVDATQADETTANKPRRRRAPRRRSQKSAETTAAAESAEAESRENMAEEPAGAEPVAAMTPVDAAAESPDTADTAETPAVDATQADETTANKPRRRRAPRRKPATEAALDKAIDPLPEAVPSTPELANDGALDATPAFEAMDEPVPVDEPVLMAVGAMPPPQEKKPKRGWWQRVAR